jgi:hypothetical protein
MFSLIFFHFVFLSLLIINRMKNTCELLKLFLGDVKIYLWILLWPLSKFLCMGTFILLFTFFFVIQHKMSFYRILWSQVSDINLFAAVLIVFVDKY